MSFKEFDTHLQSFNLEHNQTKIGIYKNKQFSKKDPVEIFTILVNQRINWLSNDIYGRNIVHYMAMKDSCTCLMNLFTVMDSIQPKRNN